MECKISCYFPIR